MAYYAEELATPPSITVPDGGAGLVVTFKPGTGYPTGTPGTPVYYPNTPAIPSAVTNPHGIANTPDEFPAVIAAPLATPYAYAYSFQTFEEKIAGTGYVPAVAVTVAANEPYPVSA